MYKRQIHDIDNAYMNKGGIAILKGNLAPLGSVIKESAVEKERLTYEGTAKCYDSEMCIRDRASPGKNALFSPFTCRIYPLGFQIAMGL